MDRMVSGYKSANESHATTGDMPMGQFIHDIQSGAHCNAVGAVREIQDEQERRDVKAATLPATTVGGVFRPSRRLGHMLSSTHTVPVDLDHVDPEEAKDFCKTVRCVVCAFTSASGQGLKVVCAIASRHRYPRASWWAEHFTRMWSQAAGLFRDRYEVDPSGSDATRLMFTSDDRATYIPDRFSPLLYRPEIEQSQTAPAPGLPKEALPPEIAAEVEAGATSRVYGHDGAAVPVSASGGNVHAALGKLEEAGYGSNDKTLIAVGLCLKANGYDFEVWDTSAENGGCTCGSAVRRVRWDSLKGADTDMRVVFGLAKKV